MSDNDKNVRYKVSIEPINTPPIFTISKEGKIIFGEAVKNYPHDEQAREFIKCVEQIIVNQPQSGAYQLGYDTARAEVIAEVTDIKEFIEGCFDIDVNSKLSERVDFSTRYQQIINELGDLITKLERGAE